MLKTVTRVMVVVIILVLLLTTGLYIFANKERIQSYSSNLFTSIRAKFDKDEAPPTEKTTPVGEEENPDDQGQEEQGEEGDESGEGEGEEGEEGEEEGEEVEIKMETVALPVFPFPTMIKADVTAENIIFILGNGTQGNLWLAKKVEDTWYTEAGPLYCRLGVGGLAVGWHTPGELYYTTPVADIAWPGTTSAFHHLALELEGKDMQPYYIHAASTATAGSGFISLEERDMKRLCQWLDPTAETLVGVFYAKNADWTVEKGMADGFVYLTDIAPTIREEVRYATDENFMGRAMEGYLGNRIVVTESVAKALANVQALLETQGLGLLVYDGYRPARAVENIFAWLDDPNDPGKKEQYYPDLDKEALRGIYLAENSPHTNGIAVDLTICNPETGKPLDMGTDFDFFSTASWYSSEEVTAAQQKNRKLLRDAMARYGFEGYSAEWWHFNYNLQTTHGPYDFVIPQ